MPGGLLLWSTVLGPGRSDSRSDPHVRNWRISELSKPGSGRPKQRRLSHAIEDELHGEPREQDAGYPADNIGARLSQTAHKML